MSQRENFLGEDAPRASFQFLLIPELEPVIHVIIDMEPARLEMVSRLAATVGMCYPSWIFFRFRFCIKIIVVRYLKYSLK